MSTINTKEHAFHYIELVTDKARSMKFSAGTFTLEGYRFTYEAAIAWDGTGDAPSRVQSLADYIGVTALQAKAYAIATMAQTDALFEATENLKYTAKKEINALADDATPEQIQAVYNKHLVIFETMMYG